MTESQSCRIQIGERKGWNTRMKKEGKSKREEESKNINNDKIRKFETSNNLN